MLLDAKGTVRAVEFAPHQFGLKMVRTPAIFYELESDAFLFFVTAVARYRLLYPQTTTFAYMNATNFPRLQHGNYPKK